MDLCVGLSALIFVPIGGAAGELQQATSETGSGEFPNVQGKKEKKSREAKRSKGSKPKA